MILRSVVGKLWLTIIVLVSLVLSFFSLFLNLQVDKSYLSDQEKSLQMLANKMRNTLESTNVNPDAYLNNVFDIAELFHTYVVLLDPKGSVQKTGALSAQIEPQQYQSLLTKEHLQRINRGEMITVNKKMLFKNQQSQESVQKNDLLFVATPYQKNGKIVGVVLLYQSQDMLSETDIKWWIFYAACIGIILTTIFAFFLSTRISQPLIQMKKAAEKMSRGQFSVRLPVRAHERDEIADLAMTLNRMAGQLEDSIHQLSHGKEQLASILRSMSDGVITIDVSGKVVITNPPAHHFLEMFQPDDREHEDDLPKPLQSFYQRVVKENILFKADLVVNGHTFSVVMTSLYGKDQGRGVVAVIRDVTEARRLDKLRKDFVANVSHELRTPLSMLQGYSEALIDEIAETPEERKEIAQVINEESERMGRLVRELLDLARMETGHISIHVAPVKVDELTTRMIRKFYSLAREQEVELLSEIEPGLEAHWDEDKIEQVLTNLVDNAIRHTPAGGTVELNVKKSRDGKEILLQVKDTGSGIPEEDIPFIFERFYKADKARTRGQSGGTGLGLSIAKHLVTAHDGEIQVSSTLGKGTRFAICLPIIAEETIQ